MDRRRLAAFGALLPLLWGALLACSDPDSVPAASSEPAIWDDPDPRLARMLQPDTSDPLERDLPIVRVLVSYDASNYFIDTGQPRGFEYELMTGFERFLAKKMGGAIPPRVVFVALPFDRLIPALAEGRGDLAASGLTITSDREELVDFSHPYRQGVREAVVRHRDADPIATARDLSGHTVHVVRGSSYATHLERLNETLREEGAPPVTIEPAPASLRIEDLLEMVHAGIYSYTVADEHRAQIWADLLGDLVIEPASTNEGGELAWAVRKDNMRLRTQLDDYARTRLAGTYHGNLLFRRYYETTRWIRNPGDPGTRGRIAKLRPHLERHAAEHGFEWLALAAIAYQESGLDSAARSPDGAVGVMQVKPTTAADPNVGVSGIEQDDETNIRAAARYLAFLRDRYFSDPAIGPAARFDFTVAAYNAGPARVRKLRAAAAREGLDPDLWFGHVEYTALRTQGRETVQYVGNVNKYYVALRSMEAQLLQRAR